jgi:hypothetical protein
LLSDAEGSDNLLRLDRDAQLLEHLPRVSSYQAAIEDAESVPGKSAKENIFLRRETRSERQFLVDDDDAG